MEPEPHNLRTQRHAELGELIRSSVETIVDQWSNLARTEQQSAALAHRAELRNHLPLFLDEFGARLATRGDTENAGGPPASARNHGQQRWRHGWRLNELIRDYQLLRLALVDFLDSALDRDLLLDETKAIGLLLDDAIEDAVVAYTDYQEKSLAESEHLSRGTFENAAVGIAHVDQQGNWVRANDRLCRLMGYKADELTHTNFEQFVHPRDYERHKANTRRLLAGEIDHFYGEIRCQNRAGKTLWLHATVSPQRSSNDEFLYFILILEDISRRRRLDQELKKAKLAAEEGSRLKSEFVANVSHEIRTPMNAILGMTELALEEELTPELQDYLTTAHESAKSLLSLVNDLLDFSRMEAGKLELEHTKFDLWQTIDETAKSLSISASEKGLELLTDVAEDVPRYVEGDPFRLRQVITNLVTNAIKFTERGEVVVLANLEERTNTHALVRFTVRDTGIGISPDDIQRVFAPFMQADASTTRVFGGSGLGLAICSELISQLGGSIDVKSEVGKGSEFFFTAQLKEAPVPPDVVRRRRDKVKHLRGRRVLVADDNASNRRILDDLLSRFGLQVDLLDSGDAAIHKIRMAAESNMPYDIVIVDALMPGTDGFSVIETLNSEKAFASTTVLMISSADRSTFTERTSSLAIDGYLDKPVTRRDLLNVLSAIASDETEPTDGDAKAVTIPTTLQILIVEDTPANQKVVQTILKKRGHMTTIANNGREALDKLDEAEFDLVLMDVQMPTVDGYQATVAIREREQANNRESRIPVIAMTAHAMKGDADRCLEAGMDDYIPKPIDSKRLVELVEHWGSAGTMEPTREPEMKTTPATKQIADFDVALRRLDNNQQLLKDMINFFREDTPDLLEALEKGLASDDVAETARAAHSIKGLASSFEATHVTTLAAEMETHARNGEMSAIPSKLVKLRSAIDELLKCCDDYLA